MIENKINKNTLALGLMSGTSLDGIDAALLETDGDRYVKAGMFICLPYDLNSLSFDRSFRIILTLGQPLTSKNIFLFFQNPNNLG